jgi:hypothetical protein
MKLIEIIIQNEKALRLLTKEFPGLASDHLFVTPGLNEVGKDDELRKPRLAEYVKAGYIGAAKKKNGLHLTTNAFDNEPVGSEDMIAYKYQNSILDAHIMPLKEEFFDSNYNIKALHFIFGALFKYKDDSVDKLPEILKEEYQWDLCLAKNISDLPQQIHQNVDKRRNQIINRYELLATIEWGRRMRKIDPKANIKIADVDYNINMENPSKFYEDRVREIETLNIVGVSLDALCVHRDNLAKKYSDQSVDLK